MIDWLFISAAQAATAHGGGGHSGGGVDPMHQFTIERYIPLRIFGYDASFTNASLWMVMSITLVTVFLLYSMRHGSLIPNRVQGVGEAKLMRYGDVMLAAVASFAEEQG